MRRPGTVLALMVCLFMSTSCEWIASLIHDDEVVAKFGDAKLYRSQIASILPSGLSPEDSTNLAKQYIQSWASDLIFMQVASEQLSKNEMDVTAEIEDYRRSLLRYRYEQRYINERLDTLVVPAQIEAYYDGHKDLFALDVPIVKARFLDIMQESPELENLKKKMSSDKYEDLAEADSLAYSSALKYIDRSEKWVDMVTLARDFGTDYATLLANLDKNGFITIPDERGDVKIAYILDIKKSGTAPLDYCEDRIKDIIISNRKHALISTLERDLLNEALDNENLVIY